jgi:O-acetyl-ADP-ribose deacetylase (regulator of RNase III)
MIQWLTDFPKLYYSASDRPQIFQENEIISFTSILPWGGLPRFKRANDKCSELGISPTSSEWTCSLNAATDAPFSCFQDSFSPISERRALFPGPSRWLSSPLAVDRAANSKLALYCGKIWQLRLDAIAVDAPEDYRARIRTVYWDVLEAAGRRREMAQSLALLDECQIGAVGVAPAGNLPAGALLLTAAPAYKAGYEHSSYASLHVCYRKIMEAAVDNGFRKVGPAAAGKVVGGRGGLAAGEGGEVPV